MRPKDRKVDLAQNIRNSSVRELAHKIKGLSKHPRFAFFLGAGASRQSGIITAGEMVTLFKEYLFAERCPEQFVTEGAKEEWLRGQDWYHLNRCSEYSNLFEQFEPKEIGRQRYIESIIEGHEPSFGYVVLANLLARNYINTVITTNFDDLVYGACTSYTAMRPIVYAYGVLASEMRITAQRPKILKLHGDYLYSAIKNTDAETAVQDPNMSRQVTQVLSEYGLVVVGYSGNDKSILEILSTISDKNDLYWCVVRGSDLSADVKNLLRDKGGFLVEVDGFDELMNEIRQVVGFDVGNMFGSIQERQDQMIEKLKTFAPKYSTDILSEIVQALKAQAKQAQKGQKQIKRVQYLDLLTRANKALEAFDYIKAEELFRKLIKIDPKDPDVLMGLGVAVGNQSKNFAEAKELFQRAIDNKPEAPSTTAWAYNNLGVLYYKRLRRLKEAEEMCSKAVELYPTYTSAYYNLVMILRMRKRYAEALPIAQKWEQLEPRSTAVMSSLSVIHQKLKHKKLSKHYLVLARKLVKATDYYNTACIEAIEGNTGAALDFLKQAAAKKMVDRVWAMRDPDLENIRNSKLFTDALKSSPSRRPRA